MGAGKKTVKRVGKAKGAQAAKVLRAPAAKAPRAKPAAKPQVKQDPTKFTIKTGQDPKGFGRDGLLPWQREAFAKCKGKPVAGIVSPTGSGKSMVQRLLAKDWARRGHAVLLVVPQNAIKTSFIAPSEGEPKGSARYWPGAQNSSVSDLREFFSEPARGEIRLATAAALVAADKDVQVPSSVVLIIDEAHHIQSDDDESNRLGALVARHVEGGGRLVVATATMMRGDNKKILGGVLDGKLTQENVYHRTLAAHFRNARFLKSVTFQVIFGDPMKAIRKLYADDATTPTVLWLPPVNSSAAKALGHGALESPQGGALEKKLRRIPGLGEHAVSLVNPKTRPGFVEVLTERKESPAPLSLICQDVAKEGFDLPCLRRAVVIGLRGSVTDLLQMIGRVLRDAPGPRGGARHAEVDILVPTDAGQDVDTLVDSYLDGLVAIMSAAWFTLNDVQGVSQDVQKKVLGAQLKKALSKGPTAVEDDEDSEAGDAGLDGLDDFDNDCEKNGAPADQMRRGVCKLLETMAGLAEGTMGRSTVAIHAGMRTFARRVDAETFERVSARLAERAAEMNTITPQKRTEIVRELRANPKEGYWGIAKRCGVSFNPVKKIAEEEGLQRDGLRLDPALRAKVVKELRANPKEGYKPIAKRCGVHFDTVKKIAEEEGLQRDYVRLDPVLRAKVVKELRANPKESYLSIAKRCGVSKDAVKRIAEKEGLQRDYVQLDPALRAKVVKELRANPKEGYNTIAKRCGVSNHTVKKIAEEEELQRDGSLVRGALYSATRAANARALTGEQEQALYDAMCEGLKDSSTVSRFHRKFGFCPPTAHLRRIREIVESQRADAAE